MEKNVVGSGNRRRPVCLEDRVYLVWMYKLPGARWPVLPAWPRDWLLRKVIESHGKQQSFEQEHGILWFYFFSLLITKLFFLWSLPQSYSVTLSFLSFEKNQTKPNKNSWAKYSLSDTKSLSRFKSLSQTCFNSHLPPMTWGWAGAASLNAQSELEFGELVLWFRDNFSPFFSV